MNNAQLCWADENRFAEGEIVWQVAEKPQITVTPAKAGVQTKSLRKQGTIQKKWIPVFTGNPGFLLEFTPYLIRGRNDNMEIGFEF